MPILFRWLFYGCLSRVLSTMAALIAIYLIIEIFDKTRYLGHGLDVPLLIEYLLLKTPFMIGEFLPIMLLIGASVYIAEISHHHELSAMRAAGLGIDKLLAPLLSVAAVAALFGFILSEWITPLTNQRLDVIEQVHVHNQPMPSHGVQWLKEEHRFFRLTPLGENNFSLLMLETDAQGRWLQRMDASRAYYQAGEWVLMDVHISEPEATEGMHLHYREKVTIPSQVTPQTAAPPKPQYMRFGELYRYTDNLEKAGLATSNFTFTLNRKIAGPLACIIMMLFAIALCVNMGSRLTATSWGLIGAISLGLMFYVFGNASFMLASGEDLPAAYAAWLPNLLFGGLAGFLLLHREGK